MIAECCQSPSLRYYRTALLTGLALQPPAAAMLQGLLRSGNGLAAAAAIADVAHTFNTCRKNWCIAEGYLKHSIALPWA